MSLERWRLENLTQRGRKSLKGSNVVDSSTRETSTTRASKIRNLAQRTNLIARCPGLRTKYFRVALVLRRTAIIPIQPFTDECVGHSQDEKVMKMWKHINRPREQSDDSTDSQCGLANAAKESSNRGIYFRGCIFGNRPCRRGNGENFLVWGQLL